MVNNVCYGHMLLKMKGSILKHNYFAYFIYCLYVVLFFFIGKFLIYSSSADVGMLLILSVWFIPPVVFAFIPMIIVKKILLRYVVPSLKNSFSIALLTTMQSIVLPVSYSVLLALLASMIRMGFGDLPNFELWGISQTVGTIILEVCCLAMLFAWVTRSFEYQLVWHKIQDIHYVRARRILLYANIINYILVTIFFIAWQFMIFYQIPEFLWKKI